MRPIAHEGVAVAGVVLTRASLVPEIRVTAEGVYWHPVAVTDEDALVTRRIEPLTPALAKSHGPSPTSGPTLPAQRNCSPARDVTPQGFSA